jgi:hypothetical protein
VRHRTRLVAAAGLLAAFAAGLCVVSRHDVAEPPPALPTLLVKTDGNLRYTYHVPTGHEALYDVAADPKMLENLAAKRPDDLARLREEMRANIGVGTLEEIRIKQREVAARIRALGYF